MNVSNAVLIRAPLQQVYELAADVERWPILLPHYRWVRVLDRRGDWREVEMACWRDIVPIRWRAVLVLRPAIPRLDFRHVAGVTRGMVVSWNFAAGADGVWVTIQHDLELRWPLVGRAIGDLIIGPQFVSNVAGKTLHRIKELAESPHVP